MEDCYYFLYSKCKKNPCEYRHSSAAKENPILCRKWKQNGSCISECPFRHSSYHLNKKRHEMECYWEKNNGCEKARCEFKHIDPKKDEWKESKILTLEEIIEKKNNEKSSQKDNENIERNLTCEEFKEFKEFDDVQYNDNKEDCESRQFNNLNKKNYENYRYLEYEFNKKLIEKPQTENINNVYNSNNPNYTSDSYMKNNDCDSKFSNVANLNVANNINDIKSDDSRCNSNIRVNFENYNKLNDLHIFNKNSLGNSNYSIENNANLGLRNNYGNSTSENKLDSKNIADHLNNFEVTTFDNNFGFLHEQKNAEDKKYKDYKDNNFDIYSPNKVYNGNDEAGIEVINQKTFYNNVISIDNSQMQEENNSNIPCVENDVNNDNIFKTHDAIMQNEMNVYVNNKQINAGQDSLNKDNLQPAERYKKISIPINFEESTLINESFNALENLIQKKRKITIEDVKSKKMRWQDKLEFIKTNILMTEKKEKRKSLIKFEKYFDTKKN
ncbi:hypothetical protein COBT_001575 [Conglomerata obtusa]